MTSTLGAVAAGVGGDSNSNDSGSKEKDVGKVVWLVREGLCVELGHLVHRRDPEVLGILLRTMVAKKFDKSIDAAYISQEASRSGIHLGPELPILSTIRKVRMMLLLMYAISKADSINCCFILLLFDIVWSILLLFDIVYSLSEVSFYAPVIPMNVPLSLSSRIYGSHFCHFRLFSHSCPSYLFCLSSSTPLQNKNSHNTLTATLTATLKNRALAAR